MFDTISTAFMILALILGVVAGLWFGSVLGDSAAGKDREKDGKPVQRRSLVGALQNAATTSAVKLWQWRRARNKRREQEARRRGEPQD